MFNKRGFEWNIGKILIMLVVLVIMVSAVIVLLKGKAGNLLGSIKDLLKFGRAFLWLI